MPWWSNSFTNGEANAAMDAVNKRFLSQGPIVREFETRVSEYLGGVEVVATTSGTSALVMGLMALNIGHGDEVLMPDRTWIATAHAAHVLGAVPVFIEVEDSAPIMSINALERYLTDRTKAVIPVHMNGHDAHIAEVASFCEDNSLSLIEDAAQALGARNKNGFLGCQSQVGCFSLSIAKVISSGQGGFAVTSDVDTAEQLRAIRTHGVENVLEATWVRPGLNFRFTDVLASIALVQLDLLPKRLDRLREIYFRYEEELKNIEGVSLIEENISAGEIGPYIEVMVDNRARWVKLLADRGIQTREFYPQLRVADYWLKPSKTVETSFKNSDKYAEQGLYLPSGPSLTDAQITRALGAIKEVSELVTQN